MVNVAGGRAARVALAAASAIGLAGLAGWGQDWTKGGWFAWIPTAALAIAAWKLVRTHAELAERDGKDTYLRVRMAGWCLWAALWLWTLPGTRDATGWFFHWWPAHGNVPRLLRSGLFQWTLVGFVLWLVGQRRDLRVWIRRAWWVPALVASVGALSLFLVRTGGRSLYGDDHPSFLFRLWTWSQTYPWPVSWVPHWNGGLVDASPAASGVPLLGWLFWPLWRMFDPHRVYTLVVGATLSLLVPGLAIWSVARVGGGRIAQGIAAVVALVPTQGAMVWSLHFGTLPSVISAALSMPLVALLTLVWREANVPFRRSILLGVVAAGFVMWPPALVPSSALVLGVLASPQKAWQRRATWLVAGLVGAVLLWPTVVGILNGAHVAHFVEVRAARNFLAEWIRGLQRGLGLLRSTHPWLVFMGVLGGLWGIAGSDAALRYWVRWAIGGWLVWALWGEMIWPELQLGRVSLAVGYAAILPAALATEELLDRRDVPSVLRAFLLSMWFVSVPSAIAHYGARVHGPYRVMSVEIQEMAAWIHRNAPEGSRVLWAGPTVHGVGGGHVAYLPVLTGRSMMACDFYHFSPRQVEYNYPPRAFRKPPDAIFEFFDLYNVSVVMTLDDSWKRWLRSYPNRIEDVAAFGRSGRIVAFRLKRPPPGMFLVGAGRVVERVNGLEVTVEDPNQPVVLRYNWDPRLFAPAPAELRPFQTEKGVKLIELLPRGQRVVQIQWAVRRRPRSDPRTLVPTVSK